MSRSKQVKSDLGDVIEGGTNHAPVDPKQEEPPVIPPAPTPVKACVYVLASGPQFGASVSVVQMEEPDQNGRCNLALDISPDRRYQTKAPYSAGKEPGTWHYA